MKKYIIICIINLLAATTKIDAQLAPIRPQKILTDAEEFNLFDNWALDYQFIPEESKDISRRDLWKKIIKKYRNQIDSLKKNNGTQQLQLINSAFQKMEKDTTIFHNASILANKADTNVQNHLNQLDKIQSIPKLFTTVNDSIRRHYRLRLKNLNSICLFPAIDNYSAEQFFGTANTDGASANSTLIAQQLLLNYNNTSNDLTLYQEIYADYLGPVRLGFGSALNLPKDTTTTNGKQDLLQQKSFSKLITGGGNFTLTACFPLMRIKTNDNILQFSSLANPKFNLDAPAAESSATTFSQHTTLSWDNQLFINSKKNIFGFNLGFGISYINGNSTFKDYLALTGNDRKGFALGIYSFGLSLGQSVMIKYTGYTGPDFINNQLKGNLTLAVLPGKINN